MGETIKANCLNCCDASISCVAMTPSRVNSINIRWIPPDPGWICLNTDGPLKRDLGFAVVEVW